MPVIHKKHKIVAKMCKKHAKQLQNPTWYMERRLELMGKQWDAWTGFKVRTKNNLAPLVFQENHQKKQVYRQVETIWSKSPL